MTTGMRAALPALIICLALALVVLLPLVFYAPMESALAKLGLAPDIALLIFLGILGEYTMRIYVEVKGRPTYIVDHIYGIDDVSEAKSE